MLNVRNLLSFCLRLTLLRLPLHFMDCVSFVLAFAFCLYHMNYGLWWNVITCWKRATCSRKPPSVQQPVINSNKIWLVSEGRNETNVKQVKNSFKTNILRSLLYRDNKQRFFHIPSNVSIHADLSLSKTMNSYLLLAAFCPDPSGQCVCVQHGE